MRLIGLNGYKRAGKDTTCDIIKQLKPDVQRAGFADKLKIMAALAIGFEGEDSYLIDTMNVCKETWNFKLHFNDADEQAFDKFSGREYLQWFGGHARTVFGDTFWIDQVLPKYTGNSPAGSPVDQAVHDRYPEASILCITDVRYKNEAERVKQLGGEIWEIVRPGIESDGHGSEVSLPRDLVDQTIINDGTIDDLREKVKLVL